MKASPDKYASAAEHPASSLIEARGLVKNLHDAGRAIHVLTNLDLIVRSGEEIAIVGQSGVGKSTLLYVLGTMETPTAGKVFFEGQDVLALDPAALAEFRNRRL